MAIVASVAYVVLRQPLESEVAPVARVRLEAAPVAAPENLSVPDIVDQVAPSIVRVVASLDNRTGSGSGLVFREDGYILTSWHIVDGASQVHAVLSDGTELPAQLVREDPRYDVAVIKVDAEGLAAAEFGDSDQLRVGEDVVSIGHSLGIVGGPSVSRGIVSGLDRSVADESGKLLSNLIQTDAAIDQGSSGGALVDSDGAIVGLNVGLLASSQGANFALPANVVVSSAETLVELGVRPPPGYLGVGGVDVTPYLARVLHLPVTSGFGVRYVDPESPAASIGLMVDDIIVGIDGTVIRGQQDFTDFLKLHTTGADIVVTAVRPGLEGGTTLEIPVTLASPGT